jgi:hypothetical protein
MRFAMRKISIVGLLMGVLLLTGLHFISAQEIKEVKKYPSPFLLTTAGQTPDVLMVKITAEREKLNFTYKALAKANDLEGVQTLFLVMGVSMKGLGSAGLNMNDELLRIGQLIDQARAKGIAVVGMFAGGAGGRGGRDQITDSLLAQIAPQVDYLVVIKTGDKDGFLLSIADKNQIPLTYMNTIVDMTKIIPKIFK